MDSPYRHELEVVFGALHVAAKLSQQIIASTDKKGTVVSKPDLSPVTIADFAIQALLTATVKAAFPGDTVVGEEDASQLRSDLLLLELVYELVRDVTGYGKADDGVNGRSHLPPGVVVPNSREQMCNFIDECGAASPAKTGRTWVFDPIDGTKTYVRGELYAINVALLVDGKQVLGAVGCPNMSMDVTAPLNNSDIADTGCIVYAVRGHGAFVRPLADGSPARGMTSTTTTDTDTTSSNSNHNNNSTALVQTRSLAAVREANASPALTVADIRFVTCASIVDSGIKSVHEAVAAHVNAPYPGCDLLPWVLRWTGLAMGLGNSTVWVYNKRNRWGKIWDHAGAMLLFEESGGRITDIHGRDIDLLAGRKMTANCGFVAAPAGLHAEVLEVVRSKLVEGGHGSYLEP